MYGTTVSHLDRFNKINTHPLYEADSRLVSAGIRVFLTTPYINSTGMFLGANNTYDGNAVALTHYDEMGDSPTKVIG